MWILGHRRLTFAAYKVSHICPLSIIVGSYHSKDPVLDFCLKSITSSFPELQSFKPIIIEFCLPTHLGFWHLTCYWSPLHHLNTLAKAVVGIYSIYRNLIVSLLSCYSYSLVLYFFLPYVFIKLLFWRPCTKCTSIVLVYAPSTHFAVRPSVLVTIKVHVYQ